jgi:glycyl-tRNA synthetase beta chain
VVRILLDREWNVSMETLLARAAEPYGDRLKDRDELLAEAGAFARDRLSGHLQEDGFDADVVAAVVGASGAHPLDARARVQALSALRSTLREDFDALAAGFKRAKNILKKASAAGEPTADALVEDAERALFDAYRTVDGEVAAAEAEHRYADAFAALAGLRGPIDAFFDSVMVMADDAKLRDNRLRLLGRIVDRVQGLADLSRIAVEEKSA